MVLFMRCDAGRDRGFAWLVRRVLRAPMALVFVGVVLFVCSGMSAGEHGAFRAPDHWRLGPMLGGGGHGWVVLAEERSGRPTQYRLMHLQPRVSGAGGGSGGGGGESGDDGKSDGAGRDDTLGSIRLARVFSERPEDVVWDGDRVYVVFPAERGGAGKSVGDVVTGESDAGGSVEIVDPGSAVGVVGSGDRGGFAIGGRRVLSVRAYKAPIGGRWETYPRGRMEPRPMLPGDGSIAGLAGTGRGPAALMRMGGVVREAGREGWLLLMLGRVGWAPVVLPWEDGGGETDTADVAAPAGSSVLSLVPMPDGIGLLVRDVGGSGVRGRATLWVGEWAEETVGDDGRLRVQWSSRDLDLGVPAVGGGTGRGVLDAFAGVEGQVVGWRWVKGADVEGGRGVVEVYAARRVDGVQGAGGASLLTRLEGVPATFWVVGLGDAEDSSSSSVGGAGARLAVLWHEGGGRGQAGGGADRDDAESAGGRVAATSLEIREVSVSTGRVLFAGSARVGGPVSGDEIRLLMAVMIAVTVVVLLFVLRPERKTLSRTGDGLGLPGVVLVPAGVGALPESARVAGAGARLLAAVIDLGIAMGLSMAIHGVGFAEVIGPVWPTAGSGGASSGSGSVVPLLTVLGLAAVIGSACEGLTGRTAGKWLTGCRVISCWVRAEVDVKGGDEVAAGVENKGFGEVASSGEMGRQVVDDDGVVVSGPTWSQAVLRNVVKWGAPPLTVGVLLDPWRRHFGDLMGQTYVVESSSAGSEGEGVPASPTPGSGGET